MGLAQWTQWVRNEYEKYCGEGECVWIRWRKDNGGEGGT